MTCKAEQMSDQMVCVCGNTWDVNDTTSPACRELPPTQLPVRLSHPRAKLPARKHSADAGMDIYAVEPATLKPGVHAVLPTGVHTAIPHGHVGLVWPRSGMAAKHGVDVLAGVVDSGYSGEVMVSLINLGHEDVEIKPGDRIAQMLIQRVELWSCVEVDELGESERGANGLGSSGR